MRATSSIVQALASGYERVLCCAEIDDAWALKAELGAAYCAGRIASLLEAERTASAIAAELIAARFPAPVNGINARTYGPPGLEEDIAWVAQVDLLDVVPRFARMVGPAAEVSL